MSKYLSIRLVSWLFGVLLTVAVACAQPSADAVGVFHCNFGDEWDVNYDHWPDRWVRKSGPDYPHYVEIELADDETVGRCLQIDVDGAAAAVAGPPVRVMSRFSNSLEAKLKNERLDRSLVVITLDFYDAAGRLRQSERSKPVSTTKGWQNVHIVSVEPNSPAIERAIVGLEVLRGSKGDLQGRVSLADVRLLRLPRILVTTNNPFNVYTSPGDVAVFDIGGQASNLLFASEKYDKSDSVLRKLGIRPKREGTGGGQDEEFGEPPPDETPKETPNDGGRQTPQQPDRGGSVAPPK